MDIYDPYIEGNTRVAAYFPHAKEFINTSYDVGFLITDIEEQELRPTAYFLEKAEELWRRSKKTIWSEFKKELCLQENWNDVCYKMQGIPDDKIEYYKNLYQRTSIDWMVELTGLSIVDIEKCIGYKTNT